MALEITRQTLSPKEAAEYLGISERFLARLRAQRTVIPFKKVGGRVLYIKKDLDKFLAKPIHGFCPEVGE